MRASRLHMGQRAEVGYPVASDEDVVASLASIACAVVPGLLFALAAALVVGGHVASGPALIGLLEIAVIGFGAVVSAVHWRRPRLAVVLAAVCGSRAVALFALPLGYAVMHFSRAFPLVDPELIAIDLALGFDWRAWLAWFDAHPGFTAVLAVPYVHCQWQIPALIVAAAVSGTTRRLALVVAATTIALGAVHLFGYFWPAIGAYGALGVSPADHPGIALFSQGFTAAEVAVLRGDGALAIPAGELLGLMTFPSFHTAAAVIFAWGFWQIRPLRVPALVFNAGVIVASIPHGSHHLIDLVAGAALAVVSIVAAIRFHSALETALRARLGPLAPSPSPLPLPQPAR